MADDTQQFFEVLVMQYSGVDSGLKRVLATYGYRENHEVVVEQHVDLLRDYVRHDRRQLLVTGSLNGSYDTGVHLFLQIAREINPQLVCILYSNFDDRGMLDGLVEARTSGKEVFGTPGSASDLIKKYRDGYLNRKGYAPAKKGMGKKKADGEIQGKLEF